MNKDTGEIRPLKDISEEERRSGKWVPIPDNKLKLVKAMNRKERRAWAKGKKAIK